MTINDCHSERSEESRINSRDPSPAGSEFALNNVMLNNVIPNNVIPNLFRDLQPISASTTNFGICNQFQG